MKKLLATLIISALSFVTPLSVATVVSAQATDVCSNIPGTQPTVPTGKVKNSSDECVDESTAATTANKTAVCEGVGLTGGTNDCSGGEVAVNGVIVTVIQILSLIVGIISVIMVIIGGLKYITSTGDANKVNSAKNTILYAVIGLVVVALAQTLVRFVLTKI